MTLLQFAPARRSLAGKLLVRTCVVPALTTLLLVLALWGATLFFTPSCRYDISGSARTQAYELAKSIELFRLKNGHYPTNYQGLDIMTEGPQRPLMERVPDDRWGNRYQYLNPGIENQNGFDIRSYGPDGIWHTDDDVGNWQED